MPSETASEPLGEDPTVFATPSMPNKESWVTELLTSAQFRVFSTELFLLAYRRYRRGDKGDLVESDDHLMNASALLALFVEGDLAVQIAVAHAQTMIVYVMGQLLCRLAQGSSCR